MSFPFNEGITLPTALAAPVEDGMMLLFTLRPPRQSLCDGPSTVFWVAVVAWMVLIKPSTIPNLSWMTLARGARQLVVQDAFEICIKVKHVSLVRYTPNHTATYNFVLGVVRLKVNTADEHWCVSGGGRDDNLLSAALQVS